MNPIRKFFPLRTSVGGKFPSIKNERLVSYESQLELAFIYHLELSPKVKTYLEQPLKIESYVPDFLVELINGKKVLVEVKYASEVKENPLKIRKKVKALSKFAKGNSFLFRLVTDKDLLTQRLQNYKVLFHFLSAKVDASLFELVKTILTDKECLPFGELLQLISKSSNLDLHSVKSCVLSLIAKGLIFTNLDSQLSEKSLVSLKYFLPSSNKRGVLSWLL